MVAKKGKYTWLGETKMLCFRIKSYRSDDEIQSDRLKMMNALEVHLFRRLMTEDSVSEAVNGNALGKEHP